jgi:hypothetical protein
MGGSVKLKASRDSGMDFRIGILRPTDNFQGVMDARSHPDWLNALALRRKEPLGQGNLWGSTIQSLKI